MASKRKWMLTPEDVDTIQVAVRLVIDEIDTNIQPNYGIQVDANRADWKSDLETVLNTISSPFVGLYQSVWLAVSVEITQDVASSTGLALLVAANRLDHYAGVMPHLGDPLVHAIGLYKKTDELVKQHFSAISNDAAYLRAESLRFRLHAHWLLEHG